MRYRNCYADKKQEMSGTEDHSFRETGRMTSLFSCIYCDEEAPHYGDNFYFVYEGIQKAVHKKCIYKILNEYMRVKLW